MTAIDVCERLAALARSGYAVRPALMELPVRSEAPDDAVISVGRRAALGAPIERCLEPLGAAFGSDLPRLVASMAPSGTDWASSLEELAASIRARAEAARAAAVAGSGATLSAKTIAVLPLLLLPVAARQLSDPVAAASILLGIALGIAGYRWLVRVIPVPAPDDPIAVSADDVAALVTAGWSLDAALRNVASSRPELEGAIRRADLGAPWETALGAAAPPLAAAISDARRTGAPIAGVLRGSAAAIRREARQRFEREVQRAPVRMVVPLVCCILPSFVLIAIVPLLLGLARSA